MNPISLNVAGLVMNLVGVILLFRYGMPFRVRTGGNQVRFLSNVTDAQAVRAERPYDILGWIGLGLIVVATACQVIAALS